MATKELKKLAYTYTNKLKESIIEAFNGYDLNFEWVSGWGTSPDPVGAFPRATDVAWFECAINLVGINSNIMREFMPSDTEVIINFLTYIVKDYFLNNKDQEAHLRDVKCRFTEFVPDHSDESGLWVYIDFDLSW